MTGTDTMTEVLDRTRAREALRDYSRRRDEQAPSTRILEQLDPLIDQALAAGLDHHAIEQALRDGRRGR